MCNILTLNPVKTDYYKHGLELIEKDKYEEALNHWIAVRDSLITEGKSDFRIGIKFIEIVTQHNRKELYPLASEIFHWGLQQQEIPPIKVELIEEAERLKYIIDPFVYREILEKINNHDPVALTQMKAFWHSVNPVHGTPFNERLIEHWERIHFSRENFKKNSITSIYSDERGAIYLKYGEPDHIESGNFRLDNSRIQFFSREILRQQDEEVDMMGQDFTSTRSGNPAQTALHEHFMSNLSKTITDRVISFGISDHFEIWVYDNVKIGLPENLIFIFGRNANTGRYGLLQSPEDFIPMNAFRVQNMRNTGYQFNIGPLLQLSIYNDLKVTDDKFLDIYNELYDYLMSDESIITEGRTSYLKHKYADELQAMRQAAPSALSVYDSELPKLELDYNRFQFYNEELEPYELIVLYSYPQEFIVTDHAKYERVTNQEYPEYYLNHRLVLYDSEWAEVTHIQDFPQISFENGVIGNEFIPSTTHFRIPVSDETHNFKAHANLINKSLESNPVSGYQHEQMLTPEYIISTGKVEINSSSDSQTEHNGMFVSDLVTGYRSNIDNTLFEEDNLFIPFFIPKENILTSQQDLHFLFEVYNIPRSDDGFYTFNVEYRVIPENNRSLLRRLFGRGSDPDETITLTFDSEQPRAKNHLSVDVSNYNPGRYTLRLTVTHDGLESGVVRESSFEIATPLSGH